ncbi:FCS-Like Zinc finger 15 [Sesamum alatum]|uniref:FCS-Like Zinc finger 15 n=1 Tax=Sesamum alatum TaxID=300844 RepID=A0AAE1Y8S8_9LAMI|nr:FCS-Like Zinc finger 15 [Sesamum alatum]
MKGPKPPLLRRTAAAATEHEMVGLSVILENYKDLSEERSPRPQVISKGSMIKRPSSPTTPSSPSGFSRRRTTFSFPAEFLECCFLCKQKLLPGKDTYMYKGDKAFCSVECRCRQIFMDEEESTTTAKTGCTREYNCSLAATTTTRTTSSPSSSSSSSCSRSGKGSRNRAC